MSFEEVVRALSQTIEKSGQSKLVFGDPITLGSRTIVPVSAQISAIAGGGGGLKAASGLGLSFSLRVVPVGFLQEKGDEVSFSPIELPAELTRLVPEVELDDSELPGIAKRLAERLRAKVEGEDQAEGRGGRYRSYSKASA